MDDLSRAISMYIEPVGHLTPVSGPEAFAEAFGADAGAELMSCVKALMAETWDIPVDWQSGDLVHWTDVVQAEMRERHPELSEEATRTLAVHWSFRNR